MIYVVAVLYDKNVFVMLYIVMELLAVIHWGFIVWGIRYHKCYVVGIIDFNFMYLCVGD